MTNAMRFLGTTDEVTACDCCGRADLKSTVALETEDGETVHYGVVCAARALCVTEKDVRKGARKADDDRRRREQMSRDAADRAAYMEFQLWLDAQVPALRGDRFRQLQELGGMQAARAAYRAAA